MPKDDVSREPPRLSKGRDFHRAVAEEWLTDDSAEGDRTPEYPVHRGRVDIHVVADDVLEAVVEVKNTDWDLMAEHRLRPNALRHIRQVWKYVEALLEQGKEVSPGIIFPRVPSTPGRREKLEEWFGDYGIAVVWQDEERHGPTRCS